MRKNHFKKSFGKDLYNVQRKDANYKDDSLKRAMHPRGRV
jgi:hypothetical protein